MRIVAPMLQLLLAFSIQPGVAVAQLSASGPSEKAAECPLRLSEDLQTGKVSVCNEGDRTIKKYQLACVVYSGGMPEILHHFDVVETDLPPPDRDGLLTCMFWAVLGDGRFPMCEAGQLAIIEATDEAGHVWRLRTRNRECFGSRRITGESLPSR